MNQAEIDKQLGLLEYGDTIEIIWLDACRTLNVSDRTIQLNKAYATYKKTVGSFQAVKLDKMYLKQFIILKVESYGDKYTIISVPVACVMLLRRISTKTPIKELGVAGVPILSGGRLVKFVAKEAGVGEIIENPKDEESA